MRNHLWPALLLTALSVPASLRAQATLVEASLPDAPSSSRTTTSDSDSLASGAAPAMPAIISTEAPQPPRFEWRAATQQSMMFLIAQHGARMVQGKTRSQTDGPFFRDYARSVAGIDGWRDSDGILTNYVAHPMMGAISGYIQVQNDRGGMQQEFSGSSRYWNSRLRALAWSAAYSTQFEIGPVSEATIGNVGMTKGTSGWVDLIMTPTGGFGLMLAEDALDRYMIAPAEGDSSPPRKRFLRLVLNPCRSLANVMRKKVPWHRDTRPMSLAVAREPEMPTASDGAN